MRKTRPPRRALAALAALLLGLAGHAGGSEQSTVALGGHRFTVELANTPQARARGLMHRTHLPEGSGMLFVYERPQSVRFWNKNVAFPIDILYFDRNHRLVRIDAEIPPCLQEECPIYRSEPDIQLVLELPGGTAERLGFRRGIALGLP